MDDLKNPDPDRPQHPDFMIMSAVARENDDVWLHKIAERFNQFADYTSARYLAEGRAQVAFEEMADYYLDRKLTDSDLKAIIAAAWMDGFVTGAGTMEEKRPKPGALTTPTMSPPPDGERRKRR